jgi:hypothetical protein
MGPGAGSSTENAESRRFEVANEQLIDTICSTLKETEERPRGQITAIVEALGPERAAELITETEKIESEGGMPVPDGSRRRTPGGVFFYLARRALPPAERAKIFPNNKPQGQAKAQKPPQPPQPQRQQQAPLPPRRRIIEVDVIPSRAASRAVPNERGFERGRSFERATPVTPASIREQVLQLAPAQRRALVLELVDDLFGLEDATPSGAVSPEGAAAVREVDLSGELARRLQAIVPDLTALVKLVAAHAVRSGLPASVVEPAPESAPISAGPVSEPEPSPAIPARRKPAKVTVEDRVVRALEAEPGMRIEDLAEELDLETKQLSPIVKKLLEADRLSTTGQKRGTRYFVR